LGRLHERNKRYSRVGEENLYENIEQQPPNIFEEETQTDEFQHIPQQFPQTQMSDFQPEIQQFRHRNPVIKDDYGETKSPVKLAVEIEKHPTPKGVLELKIGGRPIDLHQIEDYMVWKINPYNMKTLMRYHNAKTMEEIKSYSRRRSGGGMPLRTIMLIMLMIGMAVIGLIIVMFMPQIMQFFRGFGGF